MNPKVSLQNHFKYNYQKGTGKTFPLSLIAEKLEKWKEDYELILEIEENNKCICNSEMHWIHKQECPENIYEEGYKFKRLYESLLYAVEVGRLNNDCLNLYSEYLSFKHNPIQLKKWEQRVEDFNTKNNSLFENFHRKLNLIHNENDTLIYIEPFLSDDFNFEIHISPDAFQGVNKLYKVLFTNYSNGNEYIQIMV